MLCFSRGLTRFNNFLTLDNAKAALKWPFHNRNITGPIIISAISVATSKTFLHLSNKSTAIFTSITFVAAVLDRKYPNAKTTLFNKIKTVASVISDRYNKVKNEKSDIKKEQKSCASLMLSFLKLSYEDLIKAKSDFLNCDFKKLSLGKVQKQTLLNICQLYPKSYKEEGNDYDERVKELLNLVSDDIKVIIQEILALDKKD